MRHSMNRNSNLWGSRLEERCYIKFMTLIKILKPNTQPQHAAKLRNNFFFQYSGQNLNHLKKGGRDEFFTGKSDQRSSHKNFIFLKL